MSDEREYPRIHYPPIADIKVNFDVHVDVFRKNACVIFGTKLTEVDVESGFIATKGCKLS